jgi:acyl-ACP thioesterase
MDARQEHFTVRSYECGADGNIRMPALMHHLQEAAAVHAEELGFGPGRLEEVECYWVLSNIRIEFARLPQWNDRITIRTWPSGHSRATATREFIGEDDRGQELFRAGSEWMVLSKRSGRPKNLLRLDIGLLETGPKALSADMTRLEPQGSYSHAEQVRVWHSCIDLNGHVNNAEYVRWSIDALRRAFPAATDTCSIQATYFREAFEGDELALSVRRDGPGHFYVLGRNVRDGDNVFAVKVSPRQS